MGLIFFEKLTSIQGLSSAWKLAILRHFFKNLPLAALFFTFFPTCSEIAKYVFSTFELVEKCQFRNSPENFDKMVAVSK